MPPPALWPSSTNPGTALPAAPSDRPPPSGSWSETRAGPDGVSTFSCCAGPESVTTRRPPAPGGPERGDDGDQHRCRGDLQDVTDPVDAARRLDVQGGGDG